LNNNIQKSELTIKNYARALCKKEKSEDNIEDLCKCEASIMTGIYKRHDNYPSAEKIIYIYEQCIKEEASFLGDYNAGDDA
jgi:hypothetical protein